MDEKTRNSLLKELYFTKEAAEYLAIPKERLEQMVRSGQLRSLKSSAEGSVFLREDLDAAAREWQKKHPVAASIEITEKRSFVSIDTTLQIAVNYFVLQSCCDFSDQRAEAAFQHASSQLNIAEPTEKIAEKLSMFAEGKAVSAEEIIARSKRISQSFSLLKNGDLVVDKAAEEYPSRFKNCETAPAYLFMRGNAELLSETVIAIIEGENFGHWGRKRAAELSEALGAAGMIAACISKTAVSEAIHASALEYRQRLIFVTPVPLNQIQDDENEPLRQSLIVSSVPPHVRNGDQSNFTAKEVLLGISAASVVVDDEGIRLTKGTEQQELHKFLTIDNLFSALESTYILEPMERKNVFSKGIEVEYVYNNK